MIRDSKKLVPKAIMESEQGRAVIMDVRTASERSVDPSVAKVHWSLQDMEAGNFPPLDKNLRIYVHCRSGARSERAKQLLERAGFASVDNLGGLADLHM